MSNTSLDDILSETDETPSEPIAQAPEADAPAPQVDDEPSGPLRDEHGRFVSKGVQEDAPPASKPDQLPQEEYKALKAEREKRQSLEAELAQIRAELAHQRQPQTPPAPPPSIWDDEQKALQHYGQQAVSAAVQQSTYESRLAMSEMLARQSIEDFGDVWTEMNQFLSQNQSVAQASAQDPHPWNYAYRAFKNHKTMQELGATDLDAMRAKMREELMAEMAAQAPAAPSLPVTLSNERNVGQRSGPAWSGPKSLDELLG